LVGALLEQRSLSIYNISRIPLHQRLQYAGTG
jgi:hypothetical protein